MFFDTSFCVSAKSFTSWWYAYFADFWQMSTTAESLKIINIFWFKGHCSDTITGINET